LGEGTSGKAVAERQPKNPSEIPQALSSLQIIESLTGLHIHGFKAILGNRQLSRANPELQNVSPLNTADYGPLTCPSDVFKGTRQEAMTDVICQKSL
jgi:hypothetical protein